MDVEPFFPELIEATAGVDATQGQDVFSSGFTPEHSRLFAAGADDRFAASLDNARTNEKAVGHENSITA
jgi:hypothetical protein